MPFYPDLSGNIKLSAGWLIDQCGWKGKRIGDAGVHDKQALVLVNLGKATGKELYELSEAIKQSVLEKFGVKLDREVEVI
jgi:UDP-N-acetylmuramate dehydrogenase